MQSVQGLHSSDQQQDENRHSAQVCSERVLKKKGFQWCLN